MHKYAMAAAAAALLWGGPARAEVDCASEWALSGARRAWQAAAGQVVSHDSGSATQLPADAKGGWEIGLRPHNSGDISLDPASHLTTTSHAWLLTAGANKASITVAKFGDSAVEVTVCSYEVPASDLRSPSGALSNPTRVGSVSFPRSPSANSRAIVAPENKRSRVLAVFVTPSSWVKGGHYSIATVGAQ